MSARAAVSSEARMWRAFFWDHVTDGRIQFLVGSQLLVHWQLEAAFRWLSLLAVHCLAACFSLSHRESCCRMDVTASCDITTCLVIQVPLAVKGRGITQAWIIRDGGYGDWFGVWPGIWLLFHCFPVWVFFYLTWGHSSSVLSLPSDHCGEFSTLVAFLQLFSSVETPGRGSRKLSLDKKLACFGGSPVTARTLCVWCDSWQVFLSHNAANIMI